MDHTQLLCVQCLPFAFFACNAMHIITTHLHLYFLPSLFVSITDPAPCNLSPLLPLPQCTSYMLTPWQIPLICKENPSCARPQNSSACVVVVLQSTSVLSPGFPITSPKYPILIME
mmetsp:Transcript_131467/g.227706  ORF Transcript_131467/g.227706 Transcript_131467/m.227706 type:complete len:116 (-) Transcript_131467:693-1040(-)